jgi:hypothetical protein
MVTHCLADGFSTFLAPEHHATHAGGDGGWITCSHAVYSLMIGHEAVFNHHNPVFKRDWSVSHGIACCLFLFSVDDGIASSVVAVAAREQVLSPLTVL